MDCDENDWFCCGDIFYCGSVRFDHVFSNLVFDNPL